MKHLALVEWWWFRCCMLGDPLFALLDEAPRHNGHADIIRESLDGAVGS